MHRKSAKKDIKELANHIAGFANADGGTLAIGITDDGKLEGFENYGNKDNDILKSSIQYLKTIPEIKTEKLNIINTNGHEDFILLLHIEISHNCLIRNIIRYISDKGEAGTTELIRYTGRSKNTVLNVLKKLEELQIIEWVGTNINDPKKRYILKQ